MKRKIVVSLALMLAGLTGAATDNATAETPACMILDGKTSYAVQCAFASHTRQQSVEYPANDSIANKEELI